MTDKEMAEEYSKSACAWIEDREPLDERDIQQAFLAGLKAGSQLDKVWHDYDPGEDCYEDTHEGKWVKRENIKPKWHKVSEQIPTEEKEYLVKFTDGTVDVMTVALDGDLEPYLLAPKFDFYKDVEKWCEIPPEE